jgi:hypothetical protein
MTYSFRVKSWAHDVGSKFNAEVDAFPLKLLPSLTFFQFELCNLVGILNRRVFFLTFFVSSFSSVFALSFLFSALFDVSFDFFFWSGLLFDFAAGSTTEKLAGSAATLIFLTMTSFFKGH